MKLGPVTKLDKKNTAMRKKFGDDAMLSYCDVIVIFLIYDQFGAIQYSDSGHMVCKTYIFINSKVSNTALIRLL